MKRICTYRDAMHHIKMLEEERKAELEKCVRMVLASGLATGHADGFTELMREVLDQVEEIREALAARSAFIANGCNGIMRRS